MLKLLQVDNIEVNNQGKSWRLKAADRKQFTRLGSLGEGYSEAELAAALITGRVIKPKEKINLLIDIQQKLVEGKGGGYFRWASVFNLKQMAKTYNYLNENNLFSYEELAVKTAVASERFNELSGRIKTAEKRMAEIAVLKTHIINFAKTREFYVVYRKAGYSKKFAAEYSRLLTAKKAAYGEYRQAREKMK